MEQEKGLNRLEEPADYLDKIQEEQRALLVKIAEAFQDDDDPFK